MIKRFSSLTFYVDMTTEYVDVFLTQSSRNIFTTFKQPKTNTLEKGRHVYTTQALCTTMTLTNAKTTLRTARRHKKPRNQTELHTATAFLWVTVLHLR